MGSLADHISESITSPGSVNEKLIAFFSDPANFGGGGGGGAGLEPLVAPTIYRPGADSLISWNNTVATADLNAALTITFTAPASGKVLVILSATVYGNAGNNTFWNLRQGAADVANSMSVVGSTAQAGFTSLRIPISGLVSDQEYIWKWGGKVNASTSNLMVGPTYGAAIMEVYALPA